jgi:hypothetical protein
VIRTYSEMVQYGTFEERFEYLSLHGTVGEATFGFDRYMNQQFYRSRQWRLIRNEVKVRDMACDLGIDGYEIYDRVIIHHMNPMTAQDLEEGRSEILDPEFLICVTHDTHNAIHYGDKSLLRQPLIERRPGDTTPWRKS